MKNERTTKIKPKTVSSIKKSTTRKAKIVSDDEDENILEEKEQAVASKTEEGEKEENIKKPKKKSALKKKVKSVSDDEDEIEEEIVSDPSQLKHPKPLFELDPEGNLPKLPKSAFKMLEKDFGYECFKPHQEEAITRIACGLSTIVVLSTGYGKSLIYQFAAKLYSKAYPGSLVLVVSPLISLMQDQLHNLSRCLKAAVCDSQMGEKEYQLLLQDLNNGKINILFMSPEAIINKKIRNLPRLAFVCIDEVHCLSQWSHNFRPSYLQLGQVMF